MREIMRILIVEDSDQKYNAIISELHKRVSNLELQTTWAREYNQAMRQLRDAAFDVVILDLVIPVGKAAPNKDNSRSLIEAILGETLFAPAHIIGLTEHLDAAQNERSYFESNMFALELFSYSDLSWAEKIASKIEYLAKSKAASLSYHYNNFGTDLLVICARMENEFKPIVESVKWVSEPARRSSFFPHNECNIGSFFLSSERSIQAAIICVGEKGLAPTTAIASNAISIYRPRIVAMLGMCCGFSSQKCPSPSNLGDIIVVRESACWEEGKIIESNTHKPTFKNRAWIRDIDDYHRPIVARCVENAQDLIFPSLTPLYSTRSSRRLFNSSLLPDVKFGMLVSGSSVVASEPQIEEILGRFPTALGLDMEMFGLFIAAERAVGLRPGVIGIKGVSDFGDSKKGKAVQKLASKASFLTLKAILTQVFADTDQPQVGNRLP